MHPALTFRDSLGRSWGCEITLHQVIECRRRLGVDLFNLKEASDVDKAECLVRIVADQLASAGISLQDFCRSINARPVLIQAFEAMLSGIWAFQNPGPEGLDKLWRAREALNEGAVG